MFSLLSLLQITVQVVLSICRLLMAILMVVTTMTAFSSTEPVFGDQSSKCLFTAALNE